MSLAASIIIAGALLGGPDAPQRASSGERAVARVTAYVLGQWPAHPKLGFRVGQEGPDGPAEPARGPVRTMTRDEFAALLEEARTAGGSVCVAPTLEVSCGDVASARVVTTGPEAPPAGFRVQVAPECLADGRTVVTLDYEGYGLAVRPPASGFTDGDRVRAAGRRVTLDAGLVGLTLATGYVGAPMQLVAISAERAMAAERNGSGAEAQWRRLFDERSLDGWVPVGGRASYRAVDGCIVGSVGPGPNSFLRTVDEYGDFELRLEVRLDEPGNSGIQVRSHQRDGDGRVYGYQCEIDPSERAWSGGLYDEGRRGWLHPLDGDERARAAFRVEGWNEYRILAVGPRIRTWVNGVPCADLTDDADASGFIALQVHSGSAGRIRWRNIVIREVSP
jgi:hypothetical protein